MLDAETLSYLTDEMKADLARYEDTFGSEGWKLILKWAERSAAEAQDRTFNAPTWEETLMWRGRHSAYIDLIDVEESTYKELEAYAQQVKESELTDNSLDYE